MAGCVSLTCPACKTVKWLPLYTLRQYFKRGSRFTGHCIKCKSPAIRAGHKMWLTKNAMGSHLSSGGYRQLRPTIIPEHELPMFMAMCPPSTNTVGEHRWVMARLLGRPLKSHECVDHMDGIKTNNDPSNLRLYRAGKDEAGASGYGTYYHEWQMAEKRVRELQKLLSLHNICGANGGTLP